MSWHCSLALVEDFLGVSCLGGEQCARLKSIRMQEKSCFDGRKKGSYRRSLSGMTYEPSTAARGVAAWISSLPASPASPTPLPESDAAKMTSGTSGPIPSASFAKWDHDTASWRTYQGSLFTGTTDEYSRTWPRAGIVYGGTAYRLPPLAPLTRGTGSGLWPTPRATEWKGCGPVGSKSHQHRLKRHYLDAFLLQLERQEKGPTATPKATRSGPDYARRRRPRSGGDDLVTQPGGKPNPDWLDWYMGLPISWTSVLKPMERRRFQQWLEQHGVF